MINNMIKIPRSPRVHNVGLGEVMLLSISSPPVFRFLSLKFGLCKAGILSLYYACIWRMMSSVKKKLTSEHHNKKVKTYKKYGSLLPFVLPRVDDPTNRRFFLASAEEISSTLLDFVCTRMYR